MLLFKIVQLILKKDYNAYDFIFFINPGKVSLIIDLNLKTQNIHVIKILFPCDNLKKSSLTFFNPSLCF